MRKVILKNIDDLTKLAEKQAADFISGRSKHIGLVGPLGAGKTTFVGELLKILGAKSLTTSPTFTIMHEYATAKGKMLHADLYRINSKDRETIEMLKEQIANADFTVIEWIDRVPSLKKLMDRVYIMNFGETEGSRKISIKERQ